MGEGKEGYILLLAYSLIFTSNSIVNKKRGGSRFQLPLFFHCLGNDDQLLKLHHLTLAL